MLAGEVDFCVAKRRWSCKYAVCNALLEILRRFAPQNDIKNVTLSRALGLIVGVGGFRRLDALYNYVGASFRNI